MIQSKKISVIVPVYNTQLFLERCLRSMINSAYRNLEIICINDGSTDKSLDILNVYAAQDSRIILIDQPNRGISAARNAGLNIATGEYISFIDSDDWIHPDYFKLLMQPVFDLGVDVSVCGHVRTVDNSALKDITSSKEVEILTRAKFMTMREVKSYVWGRIYRKEQLASLRFDEYSKIEDSDFNAKLISRNQELKIAYTSTPLYAYFIREGSLVSSVDGRDCMNLSQKLYEYALCERDAEMRQVFSIDCLKRLLSARYEYLLIGDKENAKKCHDLAVKSLKTIYVGRTKYKLMTCFPQLYRLFRILDDPTMLEWEKSQKRKYKHEKDFISHP